MGSSFLLRPPFASRPSNVRNFPDGNSALILVSARLRHIAGTEWGARRYLDMERLKEQTTEEMDQAA